MPPSVRKRKAVQESRTGAVDPHSVKTRASEQLDNATVMEEGTEQEAINSAAELHNGADQSHGEKPADAARAEFGAESGADEATSLTAVKIRGRPGGVSIEMGEGDWDDLIKALDERLSAAEGFFRGGRAVLELGPREASEERLRQVRVILVRHDMTLGIVKSTARRTLQAALMLGLSTSSEAEEPVPAEPAMAPVVAITQPQSPYFVHNGTLRSGQVLRKAESVVVLGDVNPGAQVISAGDVMVWGRLRGVAHAGAAGNKKAVVAAIEFSPTQLRIAGVAAIAPESKKTGRGLKFWQKPPERRPEVAYIADGRIVVEPWDDSRPGRPKTVRR